MAQTKRQLEAFEIYYAMDVRSYRDVGKKVGVSMQSVHKWAIKYHWQDRLEERIELDRKKREQAYLDSIKVTTDTHIALYKTLQDKGFKFFDKKDPAAAFDNGGQAARAIEIGVEGERKIMGLSPAAGPGQAPGTTITTNIQNNVNIALGEIAKNGDREVILRALKRIHLELTEGGAAKAGK